MWKTLWLVSAATCAPEIRPVERHWPGHARILWCMSCMRCASPCRREMRQRAACGSSGEAAGPGAEAGFVASAHAPRDLRGLLGFGLRSLWRRRTPPRGCFLVLPWPLCTVIRPVWPGRAWPAWHRSARVGGRRVVLLSRRGAERCPSCHRLLDFLSSILALRPLFHRDRPQAHNNDVSCFAWGAGACSGKTV